MGHQPLGGHSAVPDTAEANPGFESGSEQCGPVVAALRATRDANPVWGPNQGMERV